MRWRRGRGNFFPLFALAFAVGVLLTLLSSFRLVVAISVIALMIMTFSCFRC